MTSEQQTDREPVQLPMAPNQVHMAALAELDRLRGFVQDVTIADWSKPSAASGWTIGDVVAHLNLAMGAYGRLLEAVMESRTQRRLEAGPGSGAGAPRARPRPSS